MSHARCRRDAAGRVKRFASLLCRRYFGKPMFPALRIALAVVCGACAFFVENAVAEGAGTGSSANQADAPTEVSTRCIIVRDSILNWSFVDFGAPETNPLSTGLSDEKNCRPLTLSPDVSIAGDKDKPAFDLLTGAGDLVIAVDRKEYDQAQQKLKSTPGAFVLYLNGVPLPRDATLEAALYVKDVVALRYRIHQGSEVQRLWSMLYADGNLFTSQRLYASLGWQPANANGAALIPERSAVFARVRITTGLKLTLALLLVAVAIGVLFYIGIATDTLRDAATPAWWTVARDTRRVVVDKKNIQDQDDYMKGEFPGTSAMPAYDQNRRQAYENAALSALARNIVDETDRVKVSDAVYGLALRKNRWKPVRGTFSLSRTQLALWFAFTIATGLFLWLVYGELRRIDGSLLVLLGISVGTAGVSWVSDRTVDGRSYEPSAGFWADLITGFDNNQQQLYRYQAVVVNLLLLLVGVYHVTQQLAYPVFDSTWLIFLGISGSAYGIGKQLNETK